MSHSSRRWQETSISSVIPKPIVDRRKQSPSDITIPIIHTSLSPSFYSPENWRRAPEIYRLFTPWKRCPVDLLDPDDCKAHQGDFGAVTHLFYAAYLEKPTEVERV